MIEDRIGACQTLRKCSLVCRDWADFSQELMFLWICLSNHQQTRKLGTLLRDGVEVEALSGWSDSRLAGTVSSQKLTEEPRLDTSKPSAHGEGKRNEVSVNKKVGERFTIIVKDRPERINGA